MRTVLIAAIGTEQCTNSFLAGLVELQIQLSRYPAMSAAIDFFETQEDALAIFRQRLEFETLVMVSTRVTVPTDFFVTAPAHDVTVSAYPLPSIDWGRVEAAAKARLDDGHDGDGGDCGDGGSEPLCHAGNVYNVDLARLVPVGTRYMRVPRAAITELGAVKIRRGAPEAWTEAYVDTANPSSNHGALPYVGCLGRRSILRETMSNRAVVDELEPPAEVAVEDV